MTIKTVNLQKERLDIYELLTLALKGSEIIIEDNDKQVARLIPITSESQHRVAGLQRGTVWTSEDFDDPLPEEFWNGSH